MSEQTRPLSEDPIIPKLRALMDELNRLAMPREMLQTCDEAIEIIGALTAEKEQRKLDLREIAAAGRFW